MSYVNRIIANTIEKTPGEFEFHQAVTEVLPTLKVVLDKNPRFEAAGILERLVVPERCFVFRVPWLDDDGKTRVNVGYRVQFNSAIGPYKGGLRFHPKVSLGEIKFLGFEQTFKNSLTSLPLGGGKGGADFDPKGKSDNEVMKFCQSFMTELGKYLGATIDVPAGDIGVGAREIGYMYGQYKRINDTFEGVLTGKGLTYGGSLGRTEATGYGLLYFVNEMLQRAGKSLEGQIVTISGSGNVSIFACEKAREYGAKVVTMSDSGGFIYDADGIDLDAVKEIKLVKRGRIKDYLQYRPNAQYTEGKRVWGVPCHIALPCATQNELDENDAKELVKNGCYAVAEGANMPSSNEAIEVFLANGVLFGPAKAANAGGVATSGLEMTQNAMHTSWTRDEVDKQLHRIMVNIYAQAAGAAEEYGAKGNFVAGANIAGFLKVANAMLEQGVV
ncbi:MAG: NADP-specific glutamate dehydrogenase [Defluviitaleaceae bacterium]|nr:NADP-specific glutamate dehydrogenase [Defluviitaleaceae bacterium]